MKRNWRLWTGAFFLILLVLVAVFGPNLPFVDTELKELGAFKTEEGKFVLPPFPPMEGYPLGSNYKGVDILSLLIMGAGETLKIVLSVVVLRYVFAIPLAVAGFYSKVMEGIMHGWQQLFSFMPPIFFVAFFSGLPFIYFSDWRPVWMILVLALLETGRVAEIIHTHLGDTEKRPYIEAGIVSGCSPYRLFRNYYLPVVIPNIIVLIINDFGRILFLLSQLGIVRIFISMKFMMNEWGTGYEVVNTSPSWPILFMTILDDVRIYKWVPLSAIGAIGLTLLFLNLFAGGVQRYFETKHRMVRNDL
ncbi:ABC transporter permease subunit [Bacillus sp. B-jedd]|uniref:ABC transporter permease subunit n=1 Tax=Bacillus sp. B-jedd TaxID=1476857 RepID=UPI0005155F51|nr:ABC transporter permease subunit [Bacillus sp. B-jedd]CEG28987.1 binding-protein-dependent transporters inner membrane component [Bacillus sp. B-jedd]